MTTHVRALYDFSGEPNSSELSITQDEVLVLTRTDVGEGWWEGTNQRGQTGLFPEAYVEIHHPPAATAAAHVPSPTVSTPSQASTPHQPPPPRYDQSADDWAQQDAQDDWDDDWDEDNETYSEIGPARTAAAAAAAAAAGSAGGRSAANAATASGHPYNNAQLPPPPPPGAEDALSLTSQAAPLKKSGIFAKSGDSYILGTTNVAVSETERVFVIAAGVGGTTDYHWKPAQSVYTVSVASPTKKTKFKGMKSFIEYNLTPSFTNIPVSRRYKHFDWLHERLMDKFCLIPVPPLPDKQISGRYEDEFIEHRRVQLQEFVDWVCRHPVLSVCEVWMHFLTCTADEKRWKHGKRQAERDNLVGATYCAAIVAPEKQLLQSQVDPEVEKFGTFVVAMDGAVKGLLAMAAEQTRRYQVQWKKDQQRVGDGFSELAKALRRDEPVMQSEGLSAAVGKAAAVFIQLGQRFGDQPKADWIPFCDRLHIYRGVLSVWPDALAVQRGAIAKRKECERLVGDQKMGNVQLQEVNRRTDVMTYGVLAEMSHFRAERDTHLKETMRGLIGAQIEFYQEVVRKLQEAQRFFE